MVGFLLGAIILYSYAQVQFLNDRSDYKEQIVELQKTVEQNSSSASSERTDLENQLKAKDEIITILTEQNNIFSRLIYFTSRLDDNSTITPNSGEDINYFKRNTLYLIKQFDEQQEKLKNTKYSNGKNYSLRSLPSLLQE